MKKYLISILFSLNCLPLLAQSFPAQLKVLTYNIKGLPPLAAPGWNPERFAVIGHMLSERLANGTGPDLVVLQEVFYKEALAVVQSSGYPYTFQGPDRNGHDDVNGDYQRMFSSGTFVLSRFPILESGIINYLKTDCATYDCHANKGLLYVKVRVPGLKEVVTVFDTHMQSGEEFDQERIRQLVTLSSFVKSHSSDQGVMIFGGDFNSSPDQASFPLLKSALMASDSGETCLAPMSQCVSEGDPSLIFAKSIDHVFFRNTQADVLIPVYAIRNFTELFKGQPLSDHFGFEVGFQIGH